MIGLHPFHLGDTVGKRRERIRNLVQKDEKEKGSENLLLYLANVI